MSFFGLAITCFFWVFRQVTTKTSPPAENSVNGVCGSSHNGSSNGSSNGSVSGSEPNPAVRVAVLFAGRQSSGGHNIIWGLHEYLKGTGSKVGRGRQGGREKRLLTRPRGCPVACC